MSTVLLAVQLEVGRESCGCWGEAPQKPTSVAITIGPAAGRVCDVIRGQLAPSRQHSERVRV